MQIKTCKNIQITVAFSQDIIDRFIIIECGTEQAQQLRDVNIILLHSNMSTSINIRSDTKNYNSNDASIIAAGTP